MKRNNDIWRLLTPCGWLVGITLASGAGCSTSPVDIPNPIADNPVVVNPDHGNAGNEPNGSGTDAAIREIAWDGLPVPVRGTALGGNADGEHGCDGGYEHYEHSPRDGTQLHVVGVYEPYLADTTGEVNVHVTRPGTSVLVLSSYDAAIWKVTSAPGVTIERVIVNGHYTQEAIVPDGVPVEIHSHYQTGSNLGDTSHRWPSYGANTLVNNLESMTGLQLTSFRGCYHSTHFHIDEPGELRPPHPVSESTEPGQIAGCEHLTQESNYCMSIEGFSGYLFMLGLDSGEICSNGVIPGGDFLGDSSLGWVGDYVYTCVRGRGLARIAIADGTVDIAPLPCEMVTSHRDGLLVLIHDEDGFGRSLARYDSFAAAVENQPERVFTIDPFASRIATNGDRVFFAWHSTDSVETAVLRDGAEIVSTPLENYDTWIFGLEVTDDGQMLVGSSNGNDGLHIFDAATGAFDRIVTSQHGTINMAGIECVSGAR